MLTVRDLMTHNPITVSPDMRLWKVVEIMQKDGFRQLPVMEDGRLVGIITDRDIRLVIDFAPNEDGRSEQKQKLNLLSVRACMTPNPVTVAPETPAYRAAEMLSLYKFGALIVVEWDEVVGIITVSDFLNAFASGRSSDTISISAASGGATS